MHRSIFFLLCLLAACHKDGGSGGGDAGASTKITIAPANAMLSVMLGSTGSETYTATDQNGTDVTTSCTWMVGASFGSFSANVLTVSPHGGTTTVTASCTEGTGTTNLTVTLTGSTVTTGAPANSAMLFSSASAGTDATKTPAIEYPLDGAVAPSNLPPIDAQWTTLGNDLFHLNLTSQYVNVDLYTTGADLLIDSTSWQDVTQSAYGTTLKLTVEGLVQSTPTTKYTSTPVTMTISADTIDNTTLYWWESSNGNLVSQDFGDTGDPTVVRGECTACHSLSRAGTRIGYSRCVNNDCGTQMVGFMKYENNMWTDTMNADDMKQLGSYTTFAPVGYPYADDSQSVAAVAVGSNNLTLYDPDSGTNLPSNLDTVSTHDATAMPTRVGTMPNWSADGKTIVYASAATGSDDTDVTGSQIATLAYTYTNGMHMFGEPTFLVTQPITIAAGTYVNFFFPAYSPDDKYIVFDGALAQWRNLSNPDGEKTPAARLFLTDAAGSWQQDLTALNGTLPTDVNDNTWAHWAPNSSSSYYWVIFATERPYGHLLTPQNSAAACLANGDYQCKQIWLGAIDVTKLNGATKPTLDPSFPPVWLPGQSIAADNISPYWSVPAGIQ